MYKKWYTTSMFNSDISISPSRNAAAPSDADFLASLAAAAQGARPAWEPGEQEGQLAVDVFETETDLYIIATMAGSKSEDIEVHLHNDLLTIRGRRNFPVAGATTFHHEECYWGTFSRTIVLPTDINADAVHSEYKNGVLIIRLPKARAKSSIPILVVEE